MNLNILALTGLLLLSLSLQAKDSAGRKRVEQPHRCHMHLKEKLLKKFDKDGDGKLNEQERAALRAAIGQHRGACQGRGHQLRERLREKYDQNGDGRLNEEEREAAKAAFREKHGERDEGFRQKFVARFDLDGDGKLNEEERAAAKEAIKQRRGAGEGKGEMHARPHGEGKRGNEREGFRKRILERRSQGAIPELERIVEF